MIRLGGQRFWTRAELGGQLVALGLAGGDAVMVHAGLRKVGPMVNGADSLIGAIGDVIGVDGTLLSYVAWEEVFEDALDSDGKLPLAVKPHIPPFDPLRSRACRDHGVFAECVRTTPGARRSGNPGASVAAIGARAGWFTEAHPLHFGYGTGSPFAKLVEARGRVLMVGAPPDTISILHHAEHLANIPGKRLRRIEVPMLVDGVVDWRTITEFDTVDPVVEGLAEDYFGTVVGQFMARGGGSAGMLGDADAVLLPAAELVAFAVAWLERR